MRLILLLTILAGCSVAAPRRPLITDVLEGGTPRAKAQEILVSSGLCPVRSEASVDTFSVCDEDESPVIVFVEHDGQTVHAIEQWWRHRSSDLPERRRMDNRSGNELSTSTFVPADWALERVAHELQARYGEPTRGHVWELADERVTLSIGDYAHIVERHDFR